MGLSVHVRALRLAARMLGGKAALRRALDLASAELEDWLAGTREPPREILLAVMDLLLDELDAGAPRLRKRAGKRPAPPREP